MVGASKILTVSYGTFSCTLEGFDDPFNTMRGIAEYFRDLAADDRYFGAEPPTPDAEMLHRIAEREIQRRVEARVSDDGIVLRQVEDKVRREPEEAAAADDVEAGAHARADDMDDPFAEEDDDRNMFADIGIDKSASDNDPGDADDEAEAAEAASVSTFGDAEAVDQMPAAFDENSVAAKLSRIRAVVSRDTNATAAAAPFTGSIAAAFSDLNGTALPGSDLDDREPDEEMNASAEADRDYAEVAPEPDDAEVFPPQEDNEADTDGAPDPMPEAARHAADADMVPSQGADEETPGSSADAHSDRASGEIEQFGGMSDDPIAAAEADMLAATESEDVAHLVALDMPPAGEAGTAPEYIEEDPWASPAEAFLEEENGTPESLEQMADETGSTADLTEEAASFPEKDAFETHDEEAEAWTSEAHEDSSGDQEIQEVREDVADPQAAPPVENLAARILRLRQAALQGTPEPQAVSNAEEAEGSTGDTDSHFDAPRSDTASWGETDAENTEAHSHEAEDGPAVADGASGHESQETAASWAPDEHDQGAGNADDLDIDLDEVLGPRHRRPVTETHEPQMLESPPAPDMSEEDGIAAMRAAIAEAADGAERFAPSEDETDPQASEDDGGDDGGAFGAQDSGEVAFDRILEQTNARMDDGDSDRRRSAIAHLKAAVAATKADRLLKRIKGPEDKAREEQSQYRDDLAKVVRPNRPITRPRDEGTKTERPAQVEDKPSPLMLVSAQRVDGGGSTETGFAEPRRVHSEEISPDEAEHHKSFADFAEQMGATELPDLLEAAAAYAAFVEGKREFSRPQLMRRVAGFAHEDYNREAGLRSFGQLLRQGKIQKLRRGQFTVTEETRFNPESRFAGE